MKRERERGKEKAADAARCENEVCETGTNLAGIVIAYLKRHGACELKKEAPRGRGGRRDAAPVTDSDFNPTFRAREGDAEWRDTVPFPI